MAITAVKLKKDISKLEGVLKKGVSAAIKKDLESSLSDMKAKLLELETKPTDSPAKKASLAKKYEKKVPAAPAKKVEAAVKSPATLRKNIKEFEAIMNAASTTADVKKTMGLAIKKTQELLAKAEAENNPETKKAEPAKKNATSSSLVKKFGGEKAKAEKKVAVATHKKPISEKSLLSKNKSLRAKYMGDTYVSKNNKTGHAIDIQRDSHRKARPFGKRTSKNGKTYYEYRANRADVRRVAPHLAKGGMLSNEEARKLAKTYKSEYGDVIGFVCTWQTAGGEWEGKPVIYGAQENSIGQSYIVVSGILDDGELINVSESHDDWFANEDDAVGAAHELATNQNAFMDEYAKGGELTQYEDLPKGIVMLAQLGEVTYRGSGLGGDYKLKVGNIKKEFLVTLDDLRKLERSAGVKIRFAAPYRKEYAKGGETKGKLPDTLYVTCHLGNTFKYLKDNQAYVHYLSDLSGKEYSFVAYPKSVGNNTWAEYELAFDVRKMLALGFKIEDIHEKIDSAHDVYNVIVPDKFVIPKKTEGGSNLLKDVDKYISKVNVFLNNFALLDVEWDEDHASHSYGKTEFTKKHGTPKIKTEFFNEVGKGDKIYKDGGEIENQYAEKNSEQVWNEWTKNQRRHFLEDHSTEIQKNKGKFDIFTFVDYSFYEINEENIPPIVLQRFHEALLGHITEGQYKHGGRTQGFKILILDTTEGIEFYNEMDTDDHDEPKKVAHISPKGKVTFISKSLPEHIKHNIEEEGKDIAQYGIPEFVAFKDGGEMEDDWNDDEESYAKGGKVGKDGKWGFQLMTRIPSTGETSEYQYNVEFISPSGKLYTSYDTWHAYTKTAAEAKEDIKKRIIETGAITSLLNDEILKDDNGIQYFNLTFVVPRMAEGGIIERYSNSKEGAFGESGDVWFIDSGKPRKATIVSHLAQPTGGDRGEYRHDYVVMPENGSDTIRMGQNWFFASEEDLKAHQNKHSTFAAGGKLGEKSYYQMDNIGKAKYTINFHDGVSTHRDGSAFDDIRIFHNKKDLNEFIKKLESEGYRYRYGYAKGGLLTGKVGEKVADFVSKTSDKLSYQVHKYGDEGYVVAVRYAGYPAHFVEKVFDTSEKAIKDAKARAEQLENGGEIADSGYYDIINVSENEIELSNGARQDVIDFANDAFYFDQKEHKEPIIDDFGVAKIELERGGLYKVVSKPTKEEPIIEEESIIAETPMVIEEIETPAHFGSGNNMDVFGYQTTNFDSCGAAVAEFEKAIDEVGMDADDFYKTSIKEGLAQLAYHIDAIFQLEKTVVIFGKTTEEGITLMSTELQMVGIYNGRAGLKINTSFLNPHVWEIVKRVGADITPRGDGSTDGDYAEGEDSNQEAPAYARGGVIEKETAYLPWVIANQVAFELVDEKYPEMRDAEAADYAQNKVTEYLYKKAEKEYAKNGMFKASVGKGSNIGRDRFYAHLKEWGEDYMEEHPIKESEHQMAYAAGGEIDDSTIDSLVGRSIVMHSEGEPNLPRYYPIKKARLSPKSYSHRDLFISIGEEFGDEVIKDSKIADFLGGKEIILGGKKKYSISLYDSKEADVSEDLENFDINDLDDYERMEYERMTKANMSKKGALQVIINTVEGDFSQLSDKLSEIAIKQVNGSSYAKGGEVTKYEDLPRGIVMLAQLGEVTYRGTGNLGGGFLLKVGNIKKEFLISHDDLKKLEKSAGVKIRFAAPYREETYAKGGRTAEDLWEIKWVDGSAIIPLQPLYYIYSPTHIDPAMKGLIIATPHSNIDGMGVTNRRLVYTIKLSNFQSGKRDEAVKGFAKMFGISEDAVKSALKKSDSYAAGGSIPNNYEGQTDADIWSEWNESQRLHFLTDHKDEIAHVGGSRNGKEVIQYKYDLYRKASNSPSPGHDEYLQDSANTLRELFDKYVDRVRSYGGGTFESWKQRQQEEFNKDEKAYFARGTGRLFHRLNVNKIHGSWTLNEIAEMDFYRLPNIVMSAIDQHVNDGQYAKGGSVENKRTNDVSIHFNRATEQDMRAAGFEFDQKGNCPLFYKGKEVGFVSNFNGLMIDDEYVHELVPMIKEFRGTGVWNYSPDWKKRDRFAEGGETKGDAAYKIYFEPYTTIGGKPVQKEQLREYVGNFFDQLKKNKNVGDYNARYYFDGDYGIISTDDEKTKDFIIKALPLWDFVDATDRYKTKKLADGGELEGGGEYNKWYGGSTMSGGFGLIGKRGVDKLKEISKQNPKVLYLVVDDNNSDIAFPNVKSVWLKNGVFAKSEAIGNPIYDFTKNVVPLRPKDSMIFKFKRVSKDDNTYMGHSYADGGETKNKFSFTKFFEKFKRSDAYIGEPVTNGAGDKVFEIHAHTQPVADEIESYLKDNGASYVHGKLDKKQFQVNLSKHYADGGETETGGEEIEVMVGGYPYYLRKIDVTHLSVSNTKGKSSIPSHVAQFRSHDDDTFYKDLVEWLKGNKDIAGKEYKTFYAEGGEITDAKDDLTLKAIKFLKNKGYSIDAYSSVNQDAFLETESGESIVMVQGSKRINDGNVTDYGIAYFIDEIEEPITKTMLRHMKKEFRVDAIGHRGEVTLYTNAGVELKSTEIKKGMWEGIKIVKVPLEEIEKLAKGGHIGFEALSDKVAKSYEGKKVPSKYQKLYGKTVDKQEAKEIGNKIAGKVKAEIAAKKGGRSKKSFSAKYSK